MAPPIKKANERGGAFLESLLVTAFLLVLVTMLLVVFYALFARAWIGYQSEQALYCAAEGRPPPICKARWKSRLENFLPWGRVERLRLGKGRDKWNSEIVWTVERFRYRSARELGIRAIARNRGLSW
ncbi:MAG TPA: hypothetical protein PKC28_05760 [Bdellovibrionales bacterium]|nr:hypothetical protein [Bdellovibrionales bacterium]